MLRALKYLLFYACVVGLVFLIGIFASAQTIQTAPTSDLEYLKDLGDRAKQKGAVLGKAIITAKPAKPIGDLNIPALTQMLKDQPALRDMLNLEELHAELNQSKAPDYREYGVVMVSFSMPEQSLREIALQANQFGFTAVFRGLVNNNFQDTLAKLTEVFGDDLEQMKGFSINPTAFARFDVKAVPAYVFLGSELEPCTSKGCADDPIPEHDIVYGNILFQDAAEIVVKGAGIGAFAASELLASGGVVR